MSVVDPRNARNETYSKILEDIEGSGRCPFCPGGYTLLNQEILHELDGWTVSHVDARYRLPNTAYHFLLFPYQHLEDHTELTAGDWQAIGGLVSWVRAQFDLPAGVLTTRGGDTALTGATVRHIHAQFFVPMIENGEVKTVTAYFGPYPKKS